MEIQQPQSVQINFNNKIITLRNVTIVKNPKIITIDATQYSNFLKNSPVKLSNATATTTPVKLQLQQSNKSPISSQTLTLKSNPLMLNQMPVIKQNPKISGQPQVIRTIQPSNGVLQFKTSQNVVMSSATSTSQFRFQSFPLKQQQSVIISPPKIPINNLSPMKIQFKPQQAPFTPTNVISKALSIPTPAIVQQAVNPLEVKPPLAVQAKVIISPPQKNKVSPCVISSPEAKRPCIKFGFPCFCCDKVFDDSTVLVEHLRLKYRKTRRPSKKFEFPCFCCDEVFDDSTILVNHLRIKHSESLTVPVNKELKIRKPNVVKQEIVERAVPLIVASPASVITPKPTLSNKPETTVTSMKETTDKEHPVSEQSDDGDDDESEVNDLIMDIEETQDTDVSRSETPESPEFEEHVPTEKPEIQVKLEASFDSDFEYENYEYSSMMEPICELSCEDDSNDGIPNENEAMRLYREAMEVNYQQNGIKKRGRRKSKMPKPLVTNTSLNGILAGLLENSIKVPPGPGRGRRKEMNEEELELDRSNGVCLFSCNKCDESFKYAGDLAKHVRSHTISSPYQCSICQRKFTHIGSLNTHLRIHSGERPYKCNQCDKSFTQSNSLMVHVKSHLSNKPFQCFQCNKGFLNASSLATHTKSHTGPTAVTCPIDSCGKEFRDNNLLEEHMMTHRQSMLYQCSLCSEKFEQSCLLVQHVKSHIGDKPFQCNQCGKCFTQPGSLNTHLRIHTGEKPFECNICAKKFTQASSLSVHMKVHGEKEFKCVIDNCKKSYSQEAYLRKHILKHLEARLNDENHLMMQE